MITVLEGGVCFALTGDLLRWVLDPSHTPEEALRAAVEALGAEQGVRYELVETTLPEACRALASLRAVYATSARTGYDQVVAVMKAPTPHVLVKTHPANERLEPSRFDGLRVMRGEVVRCAGGFHVDFGDEGFTAPKRARASDQARPPVIFDINAKIREGSFVATLTDGTRSVPLRWEGEGLVSDPWPYDPATVWPHVDVAQPASP